MTKPAGEKVPKQMQGKFDEITRLTDAFSAQYLNDEYANLSRQLTAALCRKRPSPLTKGQAKSWACGIVHALGLVNFLDDSSQTPHLKAKEVYAGFGVGESTGQGKSKQIRDLMKMHQMDPNWCVPSLIERNPMIWMLSVNGYLMDIRQAPREIQEEAFRKGLIPYIPADNCHGLFEPGRDHVKQKPHGTKSDSAVVSLPMATNHTPTLIHFASQGVKTQFKLGTQYQKAGIIALDLCSESSIQGSLFGEVNDERDRALMKVMDAINRKWGRGTIGFATAGTNQPWRMKSQARSRRYTTCWEELPIVRG